MSNVRALWLERTPTTNRNADPEPGIRLLTATQAAVVLGWSPSTVRRRVADGTIPVVRVGPRWWIRWETLVGLRGDR